MLYFFNFVNGPFQGTLDGETKKKVDPGADAARALLVPLGRRLDLGHGRAPAAARLLPRPLTVDAEQRLERAAPSRWSRVDVPGPLRLRRRSRKSELGRTRRRFGAVAFVSLAWRSA